VITDAHFDTRQRIGRLIVFMARVMQSGQATRMRGIGVAEKTALLVEPDGHALVVGKGEVEFFEMTKKPLVCRAGEPLQIDNVWARSVQSGESFDLNTWQGPEKMFYVGVTRRDGKAILGMSWY